MPAAHPTKTIEGPEALPLPTLHLLKNRSYFTYFVGQFVSLTGTWMQSVALAWWVYSLTHSATAVGLVTFFNQIPAFLLSPLAGALADRVERRKLFIFVQWMGMAQALLLGFLALDPHPSFQLILTLSILGGIGTGFDATTRHSFVIDLVSKHNLPAAITLNSGLMNITRIIAPALAGIFIIKWGEVSCFFANGVSYVAILISLARIKSHSPKHPENAKHPITAGALFHSIAEGFRYLKTQRSISRVLILACFIASLSAIFAVLLPAYAKQHLGGEVHTFAWLSSAMALGSILGAIHLGLQKTLTTRIRKPVTQNMVGMGLSLGVFAFSKDLYLSLGAATVFGFFNLKSWPLMNNAIQQRVDDQMRGRVLSFFTMTFLGTQPVASLLLGSVADSIGTTLALGGVSIMILAAAAALFFGPKIPSNVRNNIQS